MKLFTIIPLTMIITTAIANDGPCLSILNSSAKTITISRDANWDDSVITIDDKEIEFSSISPKAKVEVCSFNENFDGLGEGVGTQGLILGGSNYEFRNSFSYGNYDIENNIILKKVVLDEMTGDETLKYKLYDQDQDSATLEILN